MANINIKIPDELHKKLKVEAAVNSITIKDHIIKNLEDYFKDGKH